MRRKLAALGGVLLGAALFLTAPRAGAVITRLTSLGEVLKEQQYICVARVEKLDPKRPAAVLVVAEDLKGKLPFRRLPVNLRGDSEAKKHDDVRRRLRRLAPDLPLVLFANRRGKRLTVFGYTNGTWFQMVGQQVAGKPGAAVLGFTHCEPYLRRTFRGTTADLRGVLADGLAGRRPPPPPDADVPPGLGPEAGNPKSGIRRSGGPLFAVIPTVGLGPLAVLALLFPSVFGGVLVLFRRWAAFFAVLSVGSLAYLLHGWFARDLRGSWVSTTAGLWVVLTLVTAAGLLWAWRRQLTGLRNGPAALEVPARTENTVLGLLSVSCLAAVVLYALNRTPGADPAWDLLLVLSAGVWTGTLYRLYRTLASSRAPGRPDLPTEGVMLWACLCGFVAFAATPAAPALNDQAEASPASGEFGGGSGRVAKFLRAQGTVLPKAGGMVVSSPLVVGDRVYVSAAHKAGLDTFGAVYCLDRKTRKVVWATDDDGGMKQMFSSPCVAAGRLYVGEGFHDDPDCKLYCLDARTGKKRWEFQTGSQTEATPCVAGGKVFVGAGNDGVYCLDARTGKKLWQYAAAPGKGRLLRVGASPVVAGKRLYVGSGVDRFSPDNPGETALLCLDAGTGRPVWKVPVSLPAWGAPAVAGDRVYFGLGNGDVFTEAKRPAGALLCLDARNGKKVWEVKMAGGVLGRPVLDLENVYFGARDHHCYCLDRATGKQRWKKDLGSPVIASPALVFDPEDGHTAGVFAVATAGRVCCLDPATGKAHWTYKNLENTGNAHLSSAPRVVVRRAEDGDHRWIYFGAALNGLSTPVLYRIEDVLPLPRVAP
jgi:outer membrane protein assembly factor BamB